MDGMGLPPQDQDDKADKVVQGAQSLLRGIDVLLTVGTADRPATLAELEGATGIPRASLHRLLTALCSRRMLRYDDRSRTYEVGTRIMDLSRRTLDGNALLRAAKPELARLARLTGATVCLQVLDGTELFVLDFEDADTGHGRLARRWPRSGLTDSAAGRAILGSLHTGEAEALLRKAGDPGAGGAHDLGVVKALGYVVQISKLDGQSSAVAAAVLGPHPGTPLAAIACTLDTPQNTPEQLHEIGRLFAESAKRVAGNVRAGYNPPPVLPRPAEEPRGVQVLPTGRDFVGESPVWDAATGRVWWVDVLAPALRFWDTRTQQSGRIVLPQIVAGIALSGERQLLATGEHGIFSIDTTTGACRPLVDPERDQPDNRFNTLGVDTRGRVWSSTMALDHEVGRGSLYSLDAHLNVRRHLTGIGTLKNPIFDAEARYLYISDTVQNAILRFDYDAEEGTIGAMSIFARGDGSTGQLGGLCMDAEDYVWATCIGGWRVRRYAPDGTVERDVQVPVAMPTNCTFGGHDLRTLYVTSNFIRLPPGMSTASPASGRLVAVTTPFAGRERASWHLGVY